jgi:RNA polymerase sigma factor (sigma-70 family)
LPSASRTPPEGPVDRRRLVEDHLGFVRSIAARYRGYGTPMADLVQEGTIGLMQAAERFDPARDVRFTTYAAWHVRGAILDALDASGVIRIPRSARRRLRDAACPDQVTTVRSLDAPLDGRPGATLLETIASPEPLPPPVADVDLERLRRLVRALPRAQQTVLERSFGLDGSPPEDMTRIAARCGVSPQLIRQRKAAALSRLREGLAA